MSFFLQLWRTRALLWSLVKRDLKVRYKDSVLGFFWSFGRPLFLMLILAAVFSLVLPGIYGDRGAQVPFALFLLTGLLPWMFISGALGDATQVILANGPLIKKVSINSSVFPASAVLGNLVHLGFAFFVYLIFFFYFGQRLSFDIWIAIPVLAIQTFFVLALALLTSALNVFYRDVTSIVELLIAGWFYVTPILYPVDVAFSEIAQRYPEHVGLFRLIYMLNPMAPIMIGYRRAFLFQEAAAREIADWRLAGWLLVATAISFLLFACCWRVFRKYSRQFADEL